MHARNLPTTAVLALFVQACSQPSPTTHGAPVEADEGSSTAMHLPLPAEPMHDSLTRGQLLYVPIYSSIYAKDSDRLADLASTISIRNTALRTSITISRVDYFDTKGKPLESLVTKPLMLAPMETKDFLIESDDTRGGTGASFLVEWKAEKAVSAPVVEVVNVFLTTDKSFAFSSTSRVLRDDGI